MLHHRRITTTVLVLALAAPTAAAARPGTEMGAAGDDAASAGAPTVRQDLRSPDARDAASAASSTTVLQDLRSPDARDAAAGLNRRPAEPVPAIDRTPTVVDDGFEWASAGIGAAVMLAILLGVIGIAALVAPRRGVHFRMTH